jgi:two-component system, NarL family, nitrate/nitrite response regulator NarL
VNRNSRPLAPPTAQALIVDDHPLFGEGLAMVLLREGIDATFLQPRRPDEVIDAARGVAVVLLDVRLGPGCSGPDLVGPLTALGTKVIILTEVDDIQIHLRCLDLGALTVLAKSTRLEHLVDVVQRTLLGERLAIPDDRDQLLARLRTELAGVRHQRTVFDALTPRETEVLQGLMAGRSADQLAAQQFVSLATVRSQIHAVLRKLGVNSQLAAVALAHSAGWPIDLTDSSKVRSGAG